MRTAFGHELTFCCIDLECDTTVYVKTPSGKRIQEIKISDGPFEYDQLEQSWAVNGERQSVSITYCPFCSKPLGQLDIKDPP